ncbi:MAG: hypothetical protein AAGA58_12820 [Verrucomicrobiota bacterium]
MTKKILTTVSACAVLATATANVQANTAVINFFANTTSYSGPDSLSPFVPGGPTHALINGLGGFAGLASPDWQRFTGQIYIPNFTGDGTYTNADGLGIYFHSPLLNRIEAVSLRTEGALTAASLSAGAGRVDGAPTQNRDDIYLPDFDPNGVITVMISGNTVNIDYALDFSTLPDTNAGFLRDGTTPTQISNILDAEGQQFSFIGASGSGTAVVETATIGVDDEDIPYGGYNEFDAVVSGNLGNTIVDLTRGIIDNEIAAMNISSDGRSADTTTNTVFLVDPFALESGTVTLFDLTGGPDFNASIALIPEPTVAPFMLLAALGFIAHRRRKAS